MSPATAGGTYTDRGWSAAGTCVVVAASRSGGRAVSAPAPVGALVATPTTATPPPAITALCGRLRMGCTRRGRTLTADRGQARVAALRLRVGGQPSGVPNGRLSVRVPRAATGRLRVAGVTALTRARMPLRTCTVRLLAHGTSPPS